MVGLSFFHLDFLMPSLSSTLSKPMIFVALSLGLTVAFATEQAAPSFEAATKHASATDRWKGLFIGGHLPYTTYFLNLKDSQNIFQDVEAGGKVYGQSQSPAIGTHIGYYKIRDQYQYGAVSELSFGGATSSDPFSNCGYIWSQSLLKISPDFFGSTRLRGGYIVGNTLLHISFGAAYADPKTTVSLSSGNTTQGVFVVSNSPKWRMGPAIGLGMECALDDKWSLSFDGLYANLGDKKIRTTTDEYTPSNGSTTHTTLQSYFDTQLTAWRLQLGLSYHLD